MAHLVFQRVITGLLLICVSIGALAQQVVAVPRGNPLSIMTIDGCRFEWNSNFASMKEARAFKAAESSQCIGGMATGFWVVGVQTRNHRADYAPLVVDFVLAARFTEGKPVGLQMWMMSLDIQLTHVSGNERFGKLIRLGNDPDIGIVERQIGQAIDDMASQTADRTTSQHIAFLKTMARISLNDPNDLINTFVTPYKDTPWKRDGSASGAGQVPRTPQPDDPKTLGGGARGG